MDQGLVTLYMHHGKAAQPIDQFIPVRRLEYIAQSVVIAQPGKSPGHRNEMQVVIAKHAYRAITQSTNIAKHGQRIWSAIDQIADEPQTIAFRIKRYFVDQLAQFVIAALNVTDCEYRHDLVSSPMPRCPSLQADGIELLTATRII